MNTGSIIIKWYLFFFGLIIYSMAWGEVGERLIEKDGGFSFCPPGGWIVREFPGLKFKIAIGPRDNSFTPNINITDYQFEGTLEQFTDQSINEMKNSMESFTLITNENFVTEKKVTAKRLISISKGKKQMLRYSFLYFMGPKRKFIVITCTSPADGGEKYDNIFYESLRTVELLKQIE